METIELRIDVARLSSQSRNMTFVLGGDAGVCETGSKGREASLSILRCSWFLRRVTTTTMMSSTTRATEKTAAMAAITPVLDPPFVEGLLANNRSINNKS